MGQIFHGSTKTTQAVRTPITRSKAANTALNRKPGIHVNTVAKWRRRGTVEDAAMRPKQARQVCSTVLGIEEEAVIVAF